MVRTNAPYRPAWISRIRSIRALFRLLPYLFALWRAAGRVELFHVLANSGWAWYLIAVPAILIARARRVPVIVNYRGGNAEAFFAGANSWARKLLVSVDSLVVPSGFLKAVFQRLDCAARVIPNIVDLERFGPRAAPNPGSAPHIVVTRNLERIYDLPTALRAFALVRKRFPNARMTVAGTGPELAALRALSASLGVADAVVFAGRIDRRDVPALYQAAHLMINPSVVDNMPNSVLEAFASNVPVVSTDVGGVSFIAEHDRTALLVPPGNPDAMAAAIERVLSEPGLSDRLARAAREEAKRYAWASVRELWLTEYGRVSGVGRTAVEAM